MWISLVSSSVTWENQNSSFEFSSWILELIFEFSNIDLVQFPYHPEHPIPEQITSSIYRDWNILFKEIFHDINVAGYHKHFSIS